MEFLIFGIIFLMSVIFVCSWIAKNQNICLHGRLPIFNEDAESPKKTLVIVDFQKDFYDKENGSLYVKGAEACVEPICNRIKSGEFQKVILTLDWHKMSDNSFKENGGQWPVHCVQYSEGASVHPKIMEALHESGIEYEVFLKGDTPNHEEYGAFENFDKSEDTYYDGESGNFFTVFKNFSKRSAVLFASTSDMEHEICGLAGDFCVKASYDNMVKHGLNVKPFYEGIAFIGNPFEYPLPNVKK